jgi:hypothetical protein
MGEGWWVTIQHGMRLFETASRDHGRFRGRTREDFSALEYSINDIRGHPTTQKEEDYNLPRNAHEATERAPAVDNDAAAALSLQELSGVSNHINEDEIHDWGQIWPLWGEHQSIPFAIEGLPFDYNMPAIDI